MAPMEGKGHARTGSLGRPAGQADRAPGQGRLQRTELFGGRFLRGGLGRVRRGGELQLPRQGEALQTPRGRDDIPRKGTDTRSKGTGRADSGEGIKHKTRGPGGDAVRAILAGLLFAAPALILTLVWPW